MDGADVAKGVFKDVLDDICVIVRVVVLHLEGFSSHRSAPFLGTRPISRQRQESWGSQRGVPVAGPLARQCLDRRAVLTGTNHPRGRRVILRPEHGWAKPPPVAPGETTRSLGCEWNATRSSGWPRRKAFRMRSRRRCLLASFRETLGPTKAAAEARHYGVVIAEAVPLIAG